MEPNSYLEETPIICVPNVAHWSENFALAGFAPNSGIDIFLHIGRWRKDLSLWREVVMFALPDGSVIAHRGIGDALTDISGPGGTNLKLQVVEPYRRFFWRVVAAGRRVSKQDLLDGILRNGSQQRLEAEFEFSSDLPVWDLAHVGGNTEFMGRGHIEQLGRLVGEIKFGNQRFAIDSMVNRDHSRGPRVVDDIQRHTWMHGVFENGLAFLCYEAETSATGVAYSEACVYEGGKLVPASLELGFKLPLKNNDHLLERPVAFDITYGERRLRIVAESFPTTLGYHYAAPWEFYIGRQHADSESTKGGIEQSVVFRLDGTIPGYGHMERTVPGKIVTEEL